MSDQPFSAVAGDIEFTGERFVPQAQGNIALEHVHRYLQACEIAGGKVVLDLACGEGYGAAMLAGKAHRVIGVDIAEEVIQHARRRYTNANLEFKAGSCASVPLPDSSIDLVVSFETIEHHDQHEQMMREIKRVLRPAGVLLISSPDKYHYSIEPGNRNPYHVKELYQSEFKALLGRYFKNTAYFGQRVVHGSGIFAESIATTTSSYRREDEVIAASAGMAMPAYWIAVASDDQLPRIASGVFEQRSYDAATVQAWQGIVAEREGQIATLTQAAAEREGQIATLTQAAAEREGQIATLTRVAAERERRIAALTQAVAEHNQKIEDFEHKIAEHNRRLGEILASSSWRITAPLRAVRAQMRVTRAAIERGLFRAARRAFQLLPLKNAGARLRIRTVFLKYCGPLVGLPPMRHAVSGGAALMRLRRDPQDDLRVRDRRQDFAAYLMERTDELPDDPACPITRFMFYIWRSRADLQRVFDLHDLEGRVRYCEWFAANGSREYGFPHAMSQVGAKEPADGTRDARNSPPENSHPLADGANLIGYARGEFGMGEVVRTAARAFAAAGVPFSVIDHQDAGVHGAADDSIEKWISGTPSRAVNIFHINADILPSLYFRFGTEFFARHYNIGYWAWELPKCPPEFDLALNMVDEVWTISEFVCDSFKTRSPVPVISMPLAISVPPLKREYSKATFGLPPDDFLFLFIFDAASYLERKNPLATVRAFRAAFPAGNEPVGLVLKTMNVQGADPHWQALVREAAADARIRIISTRLRRDEVLGLTSVCDAFVSLHRAEGFGICLAESMLLGKPVIATNYSGSREFAREGSACVVDYELVAVSPDAYPFWHGQQWAEPDIEHAAYLMRRLLRDEAMRAWFAQAGQRYVKEHFDPAVIGRRYAARLDKIRQRGYLNRSRLSCGGDAADGIRKEEITGFLDLPAADDNGQLVPPGALDISGWAVSNAGIAKVEIHCDDSFVDEARYGLLRPDVGQMLPAFVAAGRSGFFGRLDTSALSDGKHILKLVARSRAGNAVEWQREFRTDGANSRYMRWLARNALTEVKRKALHAEATGDILISIVLIAGEGTDRDSLAVSVESLNEQIYGNWELVICADTRQAPVVRQFLDSAGAGPRVSLCECAELTWSEAFAACRGAYIGVIDAGHVLEPRALVAVAKNIAITADAGFIYADEDRLVGSNRVAPLFKPAWSPLYLQSGNYVGRPWFCRATLLSGTVTGHERCTSATEYSLLKKIGQAAGKVVHIPMVLYSRPGDPAREADADTASSRAGDAAAHGVVRTEAVHGVWPKVSVVIPTCLRNLDVVANCFSALMLRTDYPDLEIIVVKNNVADEEGAAKFLGRWPFTVLAWDRPFNWSGINNCGARNAGGELLLFMNDDVEALNRDWLTNMVTIARQQPVGAVGAMLLYPNRTIQHGGVYLVGYGGGVRHLFASCHGTEAAIAPLVQHNRECSAVTGACLLSRREVFESVDGFDERLPLVANDVDYCLRLADLGMTSVVAAGAKLVHHEGMSRAGMPETEDIKLFRERWKERLAQADPYCNPNIDERCDDWRPNPDANGILIGRVRDGSRAAIPVSGR